MLHIGMLQLADLMSHVLHSLIPRTIVGMIDDFGSSYFIYKKDMHTDILKCVPIVLSQHPTAPLEVTLRESVLVNVLFFFIGS